MEVCNYLSTLKSQPVWIFALFTLGSISILNLLLSILRWVYVYFLRPAKNLTKYGSWALVTGPSDGIGKAFAFQLAGKGLNLVLVGRNPDKLKEVSDSIQSNHVNSQIKTVVVDFARDLDEGVIRVTETIEGLDIGVLINNAGICYPCARFFHEVDEDLLRNVIKINVEGTTKITQAVLPNMVRRKKGAIVNIGSAGAVVVHPLYSVYAGTKAYVDQFSRCLYVEYKKNGIDVQCQILFDLPFYVATKMTKFRKSFLFIPSPDSYAEAGLRWIGYEPRCTPYWPHSLVWALLRLLPESLFDSFRLRTYLAIRKKGQLKDAKKQK